jgi:hypothetical protein
VKGRSHNYAGPKWPDILEGEILRAPSGTLRVARVVHRGNGRVYVFFTIRHGSWTNRCYTLYTTNALFSIGYLRTGKHVHSFDEFDQTVADEMISCNRPPRLHPVDVKGMG